MVHAIPPCRSDLVCPFFAYSVCMLFPVNFFAQLDLSASSVSLLLVTFLLDNSGFWWHFFITAARILSRLPRFAIFSFRPSLTLGVPLMIRFQPNCQDSSPVRPGHPVFSSIFAVDACFDLRFFYVVVLLIYPSFFRLRVNRSEVLSAFFARFEPDSGPLPLEPSRICHHLLPASSLAHGVVWKR